MSFYLAHLFLVLMVTSGSLARQSQSCSNIDCFLAGVSERTSLQRLRFVILDEPAVRPVRVDMHFLIRDIRTADDSLTSTQIAERLVPMRDSFLSIMRDTCGVELDEREADFIERAFLDASDVRSLLNVLIRLGGDDLSA